MRFLKLGYHSGGPYNKEYSILGPKLGFRVQGLGIKLAGPRIPVQIPPDPYTTRALGLGFRFVRSHASIRKVWHESLHRTRKKPQPDPLEAP